MSQSAGLPASQPPHTTPSEVSARQRVKNLMQAGRFSDALSAVDGIADDSERLYMTAVCQRYLKQFEAALDAVHQLQDVAPDFARAWQEEGHIHRDAGQWDAALSAYGAAVRINPALAACWRAQSAVLEQRGNPGDKQAAARSAAQAELLEALPRDVLLAKTLLYDGKLAKAEQIIRHHLQAHPKDIEAMRVLAELSVRFNVLEDAEFLLESALDFAPDHIDARLDYVSVLRKRQKFGHALEQSKTLHACEPGSPVFTSVLAIEHLQVGDYDAALGLFDQVLETLPGDPATLTSKGHALKTYGRTDDAIASYKAAVAARPAHGDAWYALANLKTYAFSAEELAELERLSGQRALTRADQVHVQFARAKALEDAGDFEGAFAAYARGNALKRAETGYDPLKMTAELQAQAEHCTASLFADKAGQGHGAPDPIFILGLPRAGSTLLEQILASHSQIDGTLELPNILSLSQRLRGRSTMSGDSRYPGNLKDLSADQLEAMGADYIAETRIHRAGAPFFIDKMPNNFRHIGLIHLILPNAKIIDARRAPLDCCFSGFKQLFAEGQAFTYDLEDIGTYYRDYVDLMRHWDAVLPGRVLRVDHDDVLDDLDGQVRHMLDYLDLDFEPQCLDFHKTERSVRTASSEQVRQPLSSKGRGQWRPFEPYLGPLKQALGPALTEYRA